MLGTLKSIYNNVEPKNHEKEVIESAKVELRKEVEGDTFYSREYLRVLLSQLKFYVKDNTIMNIMEIKEILNYFGELFDLDDSSKILEV